MSKNLTPYMKPIQSARHSFMHKRRRRGFLSLGLAGLCAPPPPKAGSGPVSDFSGNKCYSHLGLFAESPASLEWQPENPALS